MQMIAEGADIIDVGGESTSPGADPVPEDEEIRRVVPVISRLSESINVPISIDTYKARVAESRPEGRGEHRQRYYGVASGSRYGQSRRGLTTPRWSSCTPRAIPRRCNWSPPTTMWCARSWSTSRRVASGRSGRASARADLDRSRDRIWQDGRAQPDAPEVAAGVSDAGLPHLDRHIQQVGDRPGVGSAVNERVEGTAATVAAAIAYGADAVRVHDVRVMRRVCRMTDAIVRGRP